MKLLLTLWAQDLPRRSMLASSAPEAVAVVTLLAPDAPPTLLGQTEVCQSNSPDWTKAFVLDDYELGCSMRMVVSIYDTAGSNNKHSLGSTVFVVGEVLGAPGCLLGKEFQDGGLVAAHVEPATDSGSLLFQCRALGLKNTDGLGVFNKSDPFFELQRLRRSVRTGARVWDTVYRSTHVPNNLNPVWGESHHELSVLCGGKQHQTIRLAVYDYETNGKHESMGHVDTTVNQLTEWVNETALQDVKKIHTDKALKLVKGGKEVGYIIVVAAQVSGVEAEPVQEPEVVVTAVPEEEEQDIVISGEGEEEEDVEFVPEADDLETLKPTFVNFVAGGCELRATVAIDCTASNGNPRDASSLHHFETDGGRNVYEQALFSICSVLSQYDSDRKYPVYGFGAKRNGAVNHAFSLGCDDVEVEGVGGILQAYSDTFRSGVTMSSPTDFSQVIAVAAQGAREVLQEKQSYSILLIFTSSAPTHPDTTLKALKEAESAPLSIVMIGVGSGDLSGLKALEEASNARRDMVRFVPFDGNRQALASAALEHVPHQLEAFFVSQGIQPQPPPTVDEIVVQPYNPESDDVTVPIEIAPNGQATVSGPAVVAPAAAASSSSGKGDEISKFMNRMKKQSKKMFKGQVKREFRKFQRRANREARKLVRKMAS